MNKTYLIVAGTSVASLAAGATGGYFFAKKKFDEKLSVEIDREVEATKKHFALLAMNTKPPLEEVVSGYPDEDYEAIEEPLNKELVEPAENALTNYQGFAKEPTAEVIENNIFTGQNKKKPLPPREPGTGKFLPSRKEMADEAATETSNGRTVTEPYPITEHDFMVNDVDGKEYDQESVLYFANEDTVVMASDYNEVVDNARLGQFHLNKLKNATGDQPVVYIRNDGLETDYQVTRTTDSLTEAMGLGESESDFDEVDAAEHRAAREDESASV